MVNGIWVLFWCCYKRVCMYVNYIGLIVVISVFVL